MVAKKKTGTTDGKPVGETREARPDKIGLALEDWADEESLRNELASSSIPLSIGSHDPTDAISIELRKAREAKGLSFSDLHRLTGLSRTTLHQYESGVRKPSTREMRLLCDALRVTPNQLIYGAEQPFEEKSRLHLLLDVSRDDLRVVRLAMLLNMLSKAERDAWITLLGESLKARTGGGEILNQAIDAIEAATTEIVPGVAEVIEKSFPEEKLEEIGRAVEAKLKGKEAAKRTVK